MISIAWIWMEDEPYTEEELYQQRVGARLVIGKLLGVRVLDWNGQGFDLWLRRELDSLEGQDQQLENDEQMRIYDI